MSDTSPGGGYVLGHSERELARLERQAGFFGDMTRDILVKAGIGKKMRVLDLGCGVGDVSLIAAELVGAGGAVVGIDISEQALSIARARTEAAGQSGIELIATSIEDYDGYAEFDAVIGRFILVHIPNPARVIDTIVKRLKPGTTLTFCELDLSTAEATGEVPMLRKTLDRVAAVYRNLNLEPDMGSRLHATFHAAGLEPELFGYTRIGSRADIAGFAYLAESVRSLAPAMEKLGIATEAELGVDTLADRLMAESADADACIFYPRFIGAWSRV